MRFVIFFFSLRYLRSLVQNLLLIQRFKKPITEHSPRQELLNFWLDIIFEATNEVTNGLRFPVRYAKWGGRVVCSFDEIKPRNWNILGKYSTTEQYC